MFANRLAAAPRSALLASLSVALGAATWVGPCLARPTSPVANFYQHQAWLPATDANPNAPAGKNLWEGWNQADYVVNGPANAALNEAMKNPKAGFCWPTAVVDALYPWTQYTNAAGAKPYANLFGNADITTAGKWVGASESAILGVRAAGGSVNAYLDALGFGPTTNTGGVALANTSFNVGADGLVSVRLAGRTQATTFTPLAIARQSYDNGWTGVLKIEANPKPQPTLWWDASFHALAIAGVVGDRLLVADPDSVPRNAGNSNGGWWNWSKLKAETTVAGLNAEATASLAAAVTAVNANIYTNAQAAGPAPVPGAGGYTAANLYGSITLDRNLVTDARNANYGGKSKVTNLNVISTLAMTRRSIAAAATAAAAEAPPTFRETFDWTGAIDGDIQRVQIFPVVALADSDISFTKAGWTTALTTIDPFGGSWSGGGVDLAMSSSGTFLAPGEVAETMFDTTGHATAYNVFFQFASGDWGVQAFGAVDDAFGDQVDVVPEPSTLLLLGAGCTAVALRVRRRRHG